MKKYLKQLLSAKKYWIRNMSDQEMEEISIFRHDVFPKWNYTISPSKELKM